MTNPETALSPGKIKRLALNMTFGFNGLEQQPSFWLCKLFCKLLAQFAAFSSCQVEGADR
jgi:hypothetical protein